MKKVEEIKISKANMIKICGIVSVNLQIIVSSAVLCFAHEEYWTKGVIFVGLGVLVFFLLCNVLIYKSKKWALKYSRLSTWIQVVQLGFVIFLLFFGIVEIILLKNNNVQVNVGFSYNLCLISFWIGKFLLMSIMDNRK